MGKAAKICLFRGLQEPPAHPGVDVWSPTGWRGKKIRIIPRQVGWKLGKGAAPLLEDEMSGIGGDPENWRDLGSEGRDEHPWGYPGSRETSSAVGAGPGRVGLIPAWSWQGGINPSMVGLFIDPSPCQQTPFQPLPPLPAIPGVFHCSAHPKEILGLPQPCPGPHPLPLPGMCCWCCSWGGQSRTPAALAVSGTLPTFSGIIW